MKNNRVDLKISIPKNIINSDDAKKEREYLRENILFKLIQCYGIDKIREELDNCELFFKKQVEEFDEIFKKDN